MESLTNMIGSWLADFHWRRWSWSWFHFNILRPSKFSWKKSWFRLISFRLHNIWILFRINYLYLQEILIFKKPNNFHGILVKQNSFIILKNFLYPVKIENVATSSFTLSDLDTEAKDELIEIVTYTAGNISVWIDKITFKSIRLNLNKPIYQFFEDWKLVLPMHTVGLIEELKITWYFTKQILLMLLNFY